MSTGPIEFMGESAAHETRASEYGGADGLVQPPPHVMSPSEINAARTRAARSLDGIDPVTGLDADALAAG